MAWFDPLNNSGGVSFDFFDFTYLSIPPIVVLLLNGFVKVVLFFSHPLPNKTKLKSDQDFIADFPAVFF